MAKKRKKSNSKTSEWVKATQQTASLILKLLARVIPVGLLCGLIFFGFIRVREVLYADALLDVRAIQVQPEGVFPAALKAEIDKQWLGKNIFIVDVRKVSEAFKRDASVFEAQTVKKFPDTLDVQITPRIPFAKIMFVRGGGSAVISQDGYVLEVLDAKSSFAGPALDAFETEWKKAVAGTKMAPKGLPQAVSFFQQFQKHPLSLTESISRMSLDYLGNLTVTLGAGPDVKLGRRPTDLLNSLHKLDPFLEPSERPNIHYIDLQFEDVVIKKKVR